MPLALNTPKPLNVRPLRLFAAILLPSIVTLVPEPLILVSQATAPGICAEPEEEELLEDELDELLEDELDELLDELDELLVELDEFDVPELVPPHPARNPSDTQAKTNMKKERVFIAGNSSRLLLSLCCSQNDIHIFISPSQAIKVVSRDSTDGRPSIEEPTARIG